MTNKTLICCVAGIAIAMAWPAKARHMVLHEKFTNVGCGPCARFAPASDSLLNMRLGDVVAITYHGNYPYPQDPFYLAEKDANEARMAQYGINSYPSVLLDGEYTNTSVGVIERRIDELLAEPQTMELKLSTSVCEGVLDVSVSATPLAAHPGTDLRLFVAAVEEQVPTSRMPNGQTEFHNEFRHFLQSSPQGEPMGDVSETKPYTFTASWPIAGLENPDELAVVAWIQDMAGGKVIESVYAPKSTDKSEACKLLLVSDTPSTICAPHFNARVMFRNTGYAPLTSCDICVEIGGKVQRTRWEGELDYLESTVVTTPWFTDFDFDPAVAVNKARIYIDALNGTGERSDAVSVEVPSSTMFSNSVELALFTDNKPEETSWILYDRADRAVQASEPMTEKRKFYRTVFDLPADGCFRLVFSDAGGDGIIGQYGNGYYKLSQKTADGKTRMLIQDDFGGATHEVSFSLKDAVSGLHGVSGGEFGYDSEKGLLHLPCPGVLTLCDMGGSVILHGSVEGGAMALPALCPGVYAVTFLGEGERYNKTILIK